MVCLPWGFFHTTNGGIRNRQEIEAAPGRLAGRVSRGFAADLASEFAGALARLRLAVVQATSSDNVILVF
ncbi:MAG: hypothetical protein ACRD16_04145 [Thermoanaerobaculia bacterium]